MIAQNFWEILLSSSRCQLLWQQDESKTSANRPKSAETCWIHTKFTMNVSELVLFEIKQKISKKMLITLTTLKEFVLYKAPRRDPLVDPLVAYHGNNPQAHTHTHSLSLSHHATRLSKKKVHNQVFIRQQQLRLSIGLWEWNFFHLYFNDVNAIFGWEIVI
jgi:hypothetical protein